MKVLHGLDTLEQPLRQSVLTVGNFDGFHRAHRKLLAQALSYAATDGGPVVVLTFEPHPLTVVAPAKAPQRLSTAEDKIRLLGDAGAEIIVVARSEPKLLGLTAEQFVEDVLIHRFHPTHIVEGPSFGFGRGRKGTPELLTRVASRLGAKVEIVEPVTTTLEDGKDVMVSSSLIRKLLTEGRVGEASLCLGRPYALIGTVVEGDGRGRTIGFPTANVGDLNQLVPGDGVYAGRAHVGDQTYAAAISIGSAPTFGGTKRQLEAHLLDFDGDIYGQAIRVEFQRRLRPQCTFDSPSDLIGQLRRDVEAVRAGAELPSVCESSDKAPTP